MAPTSQGESAQELGDGESAPRSGRRVHWLELFFDLVIVAYIGQVAHTMHGDPTWLDALAFFALLAAAWWAWVNATVTMNLFGTRITPSIWVAVTIAMMAVGVMAASVPEALTRPCSGVRDRQRRDPRGLGDALAHEAEDHRRPVVAAGDVLRRSGSTVAAVGRGRTAVAVPAVGGGYRDRGGAARLPRRTAGWLRDNLDIDHLIERVGLLVVIVFGESILAIIAELDAHWAVASGVTAVLGFAAVSMLAWIFFGYATAAVERGLHRLQLRGSIGGLRDTVMYLPFLLVAGIVLFASALGTAVADAGHHMPIGAAVCLAGGISLFFVASTAESLRYGAPWRDVVLWGPAGILLPWLLVPLSASVGAELVVAASVLLIAVFVALNEINVRRMRARIAA